MRNGRGFTCFTRTHSHGFADTCVTWYLEALLNGCVVSPCLVERADYSLRLARANKLEGFVRHVQGKRSATCSAHKAEMFLRCQDP